MNILDSELKIVIDIIENNTPDCEVFVFGSRLNGNSWKFSDLDLAFKCEDCLDFKRKVKLSIEFEDSDLPYKVDLVDYNKASEDFQKIIDENNKKIY
ncbi:nucleotidyltransferase domain-containing protein [Methanobrevibacter curvatus]|uniref:protein adenylyltransferase n=1 Tax=Methanobrevibacter curvatus TaxID=49547 RepID=A0A166AKA7_9EURY|nr:nucleotidyltransferase domain-containing protein [Methanobrevibacter curvatus]KZX12144.1 nucleotidyltransferase domain protein [Methanobrevibacter curvatus]